MSSIQNYNLTLTKLIPLTGLITIFSQLSLLIFYKAFNFSPIGYYDPYEILFSLIKDFIIIGILIILVMQFVAIYLDTAIDWILSKLTRKGLPLTVARINQIADDNQKYAYPIICLLILITIGLMYFNLLDPLDYMLLWICIFSFILLVNNAKFHRLTDKTRDEDNYEVDTFKFYFPYVDYSTILIIGISVALTFSMAVAKSNYFQNKNPFKGTQLTMDDGEVIKCNSLNVIIGKCNNFYFFYSTHDKGVRVVRRDRIKNEYIFTSYDSRNILFRF